MSKRWPQPRVLSAVPYDGLGVSGQFHHSEPDLGMDIRLGRGLLRVSLFVMVGAACQVYGEALYHHVSHCWYSYHDGECLV